MTYHLVFDTTDPKSPRFIELEDSTGHSISAGEWRERKDGYVELVLPAPAVWQDILTAPRVKELEWVDTGQSGFLETQYYAVSGKLRHTVHPLENIDTPFYEHYAIRWDPNFTKWKLTFWVGNNGLSGISGEFDTLEAAKAAAQQDYEGRILSALVSPPKLLSYEGEQS